MSDYQGRTDVEFYAVEGPKTFLMSCRPCEGTGKRFSELRSDLSVSRWSESRCDVCNGRGVVRFESPDVPITHASCQGTGRKRYQKTRSDYIDSDLCRRCYGYGIISLTGKIKNLSLEGTIKIHDTYVSREPVRLTAAEFHEYMIDAYERSTGYGMELPVVPVEEAGS